MKEMEKLADEHVRSTGMIVDSPVLADYLEAKEYYLAGFRKAREMAAERIRASVNKEGISDPSEGIINCWLQSKHDHDLCLSLGESEVDD